MTNQLKLIVFLFVFFSLPKQNFAQVESLFNDVSLDESMDTALQKLKSISGHTELFTIQTPVFPMAKSREDHLVCSNVKTDNGIIDKMVFLFADNKLRYGRKQ